MDGDGAFGAVGAVSGIKNPICLSRAVLEHSQKPDPLGRIPPLVLVSEGARSFALRHSIPSVSPESLICARAKNSWVRWKEKYETGVPITDTDEGFELQDTVGSVAMCGHSLAAGVSRLANTFPSSSPFFFGIQIPSDSGGILLKFPGRMGEAGIFGAGCWAQRSAQRSVACSVSGAGEYITRASLARALGSAIVCSSEEDDPHDIIHRLLRDEFWDPSRKLGEPHPNVGVLVLTKEEEAGRTIGLNQAPGFPGTVRLWCAFTTSSMALAFASTDNPKPKAFVLRQGAFTSDTDDCNPPIFITAYTLS
ncbi:hypothetical protein V5O48_003251 [Marasmius crinis-equi]|uniref:Threonine aspartase n=1 Tax=Marasmius crinis-equi TaxID=585013 RepID=A0ABR3FTQ6_9AGAR